MTCIRQHVTRRHIHSANVNHNATVSGETPSDGLPCGIESQCFDGTCEPSANLYEVTCGDGYVDLVAGEACDCGSGDCKNISRGAFLKTNNQYPMRRPHMLLISGSCWLLLHHRLRRKRLLMSKWNNRLHWSMRNRGTSPLGWRRIVR